MDDETLYRLLAHISLGVYLCVLIWLLFVLRKMVRNRATRYIYATLCLWLVFAAKDIVYLFGNMWYDLSVTNVPMSIDLWPTPIATILLLHTMQPKWLNIKRVLGMMLPFFAFTLLNIIYKGEPLVFMINQLYGFVFASIFGIVLFILTFKCDLYINANYSDFRSIDTKWLRIIIIIMYTISILWFLLAIESSWLGDAVYYLTTMVLTSLLYLFVMGCKGGVFPDYMTVDGILGGKSGGDISQESSAAMGQFAEIEERLEEVINQDKIYLNPRLSLTDLANHIGTNRTYLSRYINSYKATSFINYINDLRCAEARRILEGSTSSLSMSELSDRCGFASYSTFRRVFKQKYGCAPSSCKR